jgi:hypothetical protein
MHEGTRFDPGRGRSLGALAFRARRELFGGRGWAELGPQPIPLLSVRSSGLGAAPETLSKASIGRISYLVAEGGIYRAGHHAAHHGNYAY